MGVIGTSLLRLGSSPLPPRCHLLQCAHLSRREVCHGFDHTIGFQGHPAARGARARTDLGHHTGVLLPSWLPPRRDAAPRGPRDARAGQRHLRPSLPALRFRRRPPDAAPRQHAADRAHDRGPHRRRRAAHPPALPGAGRARGGHARRAASPVHPGGHRARGRARRHRRARGRPPARRGARGARRPRLEDRAGIGRAARVAARVLRAEQRVPRRGQAPRAQLRFRGHRRARRVILRTRTGCRRSPQAARPPLRRRGVHRRPRRAALLRGHREVPARASRSPCAAHPSSPSLWTDAETCSRAGVPPSISRS